MWRLHRSLMKICTPSETEGLALVTILVHIFPDIWSFSYRSFVEILWKFMELLRIILFTDSAVSLSLSPPHWASWRGCRNGLQTWRAAVSILNKQSGQKSNGGFPALCLCQMLTKSHLKNSQCYQILHNVVVRALPYTVMNLPVHQDTWKSSKTRGTVSFLITTLLHGVSLVYLPV